MSGMKDDYFKTAEPAAGGLCSTAVERFARDVVARLVSKTDRGGEVLRTALVDQLVDSVRKPDPAALDDLWPELKRLRIGADAFADYYIPEAARKLGRGWDDDRYSFAEVTMGAARLQAMLREIGAGWSADTALADTADASGDGTILLIIPDGEQHTLGAMVVSGQLRRMGISVCLRMAPDLGDLTQLLTQRKFDGALISLAGTTRLEPCQKTIKALKDASGNGLKVAVGGAAVALDDAVFRTLGADVVTNDLSVALDVFGLVPVQSVADAVK